MSFIQFELDALNRCPGAARAAGVAEEVVIAGLVRLWEWAWREESETCTELHLRGHFGREVGPALAAFGFLEDLGGGEWRIRGAGRYLRIKTKQREAAKETNAKRWGKRGGSERSSDESSNRSTDGSTDGSTGRSEVALAANSEQRTALKEDLSSSPEAASSPPVELPSAKVRQVFDRWREKLDHPRAKLDDKRRRAIEKGLKSWSLEDCLLAVDGCSVTPHNIGQNEKGERYDDLELIFRDASHVERFMRNAQSPPKAPASAQPYTEGTKYRW